MKQRKSGLKAVCMTAAFLAVLGIAGKSALSYALIDETNAVHIDASEIEDATLIIGSHLIYLDSMNDQIYALAMKSAEDANQYQRYYKSELAGGVWYDITDAGALSDITTTGIVVEDKVIEELFMTHHTKSDGITYDLTNGKAVSVFHIDDPYNLEEMSELEPIKLQYDVLVQTQELSDTMKRDIEYIKEIYKFDRKTDKTRELDKQIDALQAYYEVLVRDGAESEMSDMVMSAMDKLDAARRVEVLSALNDYQLQKMSQVVSREFIYQEGEITGTYTAGEETKEESDAGRDVVKNFVANTDLITAIGEAMANVQESYTSYSAKMLAEGTTVITRAEYEFYNNLIRSAQENNYAACDTAVNKLIYLNRINNSTVLKEQEEREFIRLELLEEAKKQYEASVGGGVGEEYQTLSTMAAAATKANVLKNQLSETDIVRNELQFIMQAYMDRMVPEASMEYITGCIDGIDDYRNKVQADAFEAYANTSIDSHLEWMRKTVKDLQSQMGGSELDDLSRKKQDLQTKRMTALDQNRLDEAKKIEAQMEAIDKEMDDIKEQLTNVLNSENASESEKALALAGLGSGNEAAAIQDFKSKAIEDIKNGNLDGVSSLLDGLGALTREESGQTGQAGQSGKNGLASQAADALKEVYQELVKQGLMGDDSEQLSELMTQVEDMFTQQMENSETTDLSEALLAGLIQDFVDQNMADENAEGSLEDLGSLPAGSSKKGIMDSLTKEQMGVVLAGLNRYVNETGSKTAKDMVSIYSKLSYENGSHYVYDQLRYETVEFIPTDKLSKIAGYRYIFNDSQKSVTLQKKDIYYQFDAYSISVKKGTEVVEMAYSAGFQSVIYIQEGIAQEFFDMEAEYLTSTSYGVILTRDMNELADLFAEYLLESGEEI